ncbi:MAG: hypothetical protein R3C01_09220 [Planctomycetaceae bacterium]
MKRLVLMLVTVALFGGAYRLYARYVSPHTMPPPLPPTLDITPDTPVQPPTMVNTADTYLADIEWASKAKYKVQQGERGFLYFDRHESQENHVDFEPFAMVWIDPTEPEAAPYVVHCESAQIIFEKPFRVGGSSPGRILGASLFGKVRITGPQGLVIDGANFKFSEESHQLYSDSAIRFQYDPPGNNVQRVIGQADQLQVDLIPALTSQFGDDMPRIEGVESVRLRRNVAMDFAYLEQGERRTARVTSLGPFTYELSRQLASFSETVHVQRPTHGPNSPPAFDTLFCEILALQFEPKPKAKTTGTTGELLSDDVKAKDSEPNIALVSAKSSPFGEGALRFRRLRAVGDRKHPVVMTSQSAGLSGRMLDLGYDAIERRLVLIDGEQGALLRQGPAVLRSPEMRLQHAADGKLVSAQCLGAGRFDYIQPKKSSSENLNRASAGRFNDAATVDGNEADQEDEVQIQSQWKTQLWYEPQPDGKQVVVSLEGESQVIQPGESGILADRLTLWIHSSAPSLGGKPGVFAEPNQFPRSDRRRADGVRPGLSVIPLLGEGGSQGTGSTGVVLPLQHVLAEGHVALAGRSFRAETSRLDVTFQPGIPPTLTSAQGSQTPQTLGGEGDVHQGVTPVGGEAVSPADEVWQLDARSLDLVMIQDPVTRVVGLKEAVGNGDVLMRQVNSFAGRSPQETTGLSLRGGRLQFENQGGNTQRLTISGDIAELQRDGVRIEGGLITFDRAANEARVTGKGTLRLPVNTSLTGTPLDKPGSLDIHWNRELVFDGLEARFVESVVTRMQESVMRCDEMVVSLQRRLDFTNIDPRQPAAAIHQIVGKNRVDLEFYNWEGSELTQITRAQAAEFRARHDNGAFEVRGPGRVDDWQLGRQRRVSVAPSAVAQANQPATTTTPEWAYTSLEFAGVIVGNFHKKQATLKDRVRVIYAPVDRAWRKFVRDDLTPNSEAASNAVWLGCDELELSLRPWGKGERDFVQLLAKGKTQRVELEGRLFQANADTLSYNESSELFTLRGLGTNRAHVSYQEKLGAKYKDTTAQTIQFIPSRRHLHVEESGGISGGG